MRGGVNHTRKVAQAGAVLLEYTHTRHTTHECHTRDFTHEKKRRWTEVDVGWDALKAHTYELKKHLRCQTDPPLLSLLPPSSMTVRTKEVFTNLSNVPKPLAGASCVGFAGAPVPAPVEAEGHEVVLRQDFQKRNVVGVGVEAKSVHKHHHAFALRGVPGVPDGAVEQVVVVVGLHPLVLPQGRQVFGNELV